MKAWAAIPAAALAVCLCVSMGLGPLLEPLLYTMTPLQRYYAAEYFLSGWSRNDPAATTGTRLLWKSRPAPQSKRSPKHGKAEAKPESELAVERDVTLRPLGDRLGKAAAEPFALSDGARAEGWRDVRRDNEYEPGSAVLYGFLEASVYDHQPLWRFFQSPAIGAAVLFGLALAFRLWLRGLRRRYPWRTDREAMWLAAREWSITAAARLTGGMEGRPKGFRQLEGAKLEERRGLPAPSPRPAAVNAVAEPKAKPEPPAIPQPATAPVPRPAYVWENYKGID